MLKSILLAIDESPAAAKAAEFALSLAAPLGASVEVLTVVDTKEASGLRATEPKLAEQLQATLEAAANSLLRRVSAEGAARGVPVTTTLCLGSPKKEIVDRASKADLVVLGRGGDTPNEEKHGPGSVATYVLRRSRTPRLFLDAAAPLPRRIFVGFDGSADGQMGLTVASEIARSARFPLTVFHGNPEGQAGGVLRTLQAQLKASGEPVPECVDVVASPISFCIQQYGQSPDSLFVMGAGGRHRLSDWLLGTWTERVHYECPAALLVCGPTR